MERFGVRSALFRVQSVLFGVQKEALASRGTPVVSRMEALGVLYRASWLWREEVRDVSVLSDSRMFVAAVSRLQPAR
jgi:hypothetical protein